MTNPDKELLRLISVQQSKLDILYTMLSRNMSILVQNHKLSKSGSVWSGNRSVQRRIDKLLTDFRFDLRQHFKTNISKGWDIANKRNDVLVNTYTKGTKLPKDISETMLNRNPQALNAFLARKTAGLNLSEKVWNMSGSMKLQMEQYLASGISQGIPASRMATNLKQYLKEPKNHFKGVKDPKTGKLLTSKPAKAKLVGKGVYRSSYKNALRLARNEVNIAYHKADYLRRLNLPFVTGVEVKLSNQHPVYDICDDLVGKYPKTFQFTGWHVNCLCYTVSVQMPKEKFKAFLRGENPSFKQRKSIPARAQSFVTKNAEKLKNYSNAPYFLTDNFIFDTALNTYRLKEEVGIFRAGKSVKAISKVERVLAIEARRKEHEEFFKDDRYRFVTLPKEKQELSIGTGMEVFEKHTIFGYTRTSNIYSPLNLSLRKRFADKDWIPNSTETSLLKYSDRLSESLQKLPNKKGTFKRGFDMSVGDNALDKYKKIGSIITEPSFTSTSSRKAFDGNIQFTIKGKRGKDIKLLSNFKTEDEILFDKGSKFKVKSYNVKDEQVFIELIEI